VLEALNDREPVCGGEVLCRFVDRGDDGFDLFEPACDDLELP
jgi:hypothetical protein